MLAGLEGCLRLRLILKSMSKTALEVATLCKSWSFTDFVEDREVETRSQHLIAIISGVLVSITIYKSKICPRFFRFYKVIQILWFLADLKIKISDKIEYSSTLNILFLVVWLRFKTLNYHIFITSMANRYNHSYSVTHSPSQKTAPIHSSYSHPIQWATSPTLSSIDST